MAHYLIAYGVGRMVLEVFRGDESRGYFLSNWLGETLTYSQGISLWSSRSVLWDSTGSRADRRGTHSGTRRVNNTNDANSADVRSERGDTKIAANSNAPTASTAGRKGSTSNGVSVQQSSSTA